MPNCIFRIAILLSKAWMFAERKRGEHAMPLTNNEGGKL